jgi:PAS domain S-box-containing protein
MRDTGLERRTRWTLAALVAIGGAIVIAHLLMPDTPRARAVTSDLAAAVAGLASGVVILRFGGFPGGWRASRPFGYATLGIGVYALILLFRDASGDLAARSPQPADLGLAAVAVLILLPFRKELRDHFDREDRGDVAADVALIGTAVVILAYLLIRPDFSATEPVVIAVSAVFSAACVLAMTVWGTLVLWVPTKVHAGILAAMTLMGGSGLLYTYRWVRGTYVPGTWTIDVPFALGPLVLAGVLAARHRLTREGPPSTMSGWSRTLLTALSVLLACGALAVSVAAYRAGPVGAVEESILVGLIAASLGARIVINQLASSRARRRAQEALAAKDDALMEADLALVQLRKAHQTLTASEERLRLMFETAVDGIVELDARDVVRHVNGAFCAMAGLEQEEILGRTWAEVAGSVDGAGASLVSLPYTGQAILARDGHGLHLEARTSELPGSDPGQLLLIRDVTSARVADQTIRSLFQFLQDRDVDRTRLLRRINTAIEQERNRIARDLHDGPVQGVSAASLSLEAVLLMLRTGSIDQGIEILTKVRKELSEETDNLRRLMSDLRPPVLEERGLIPALREILVRFGRESRMQANLRSRSLVDVPPELETLAYRIVQEALSNAHKHSRATSLEVVVEAVAGQIRVEVTDDGVGFDPTRARDFLRMGRVGLASMRERTELVGGTFLVRSSAGSGTTIEATLPLEPFPSRVEPAMA